MNGRQRDAVEALRRQLNEHHLSGREEGPDRDICIHQNGAEGVAVFVDRKMHRRRHR